MEKRKKKKSIWLKLLIGLLALLLALLLTGVVAVEYVLGRIGSAVDESTFATIPPELEDFETDYVEPTAPPTTVDTPSTGPDETKETEAQDETQETESATQPTEAPPATQPTQPPAPEIDWPDVDTFTDDQVINILLIGQDINASSGIGRSDSMILLSMNKRTNSIIMTSIMRDLYVQIPGYSDNRINAAYRFGGAKLLDATLLKNFGLPVDGNVAVGFDQFKKIIDILGGVDVKLTAAEANHMKNALGFADIVAGQNHLNGKQALAFCRIRKIDSDHNRTARQRRVLSAVAIAAKKAGAGTVLDVINQVLPYVSTDLSNSQIISYATTGLSILTSGSLKEGKLPQNNDYSGEVIKGMQVMVPNIWRCRKYIESFIYGKS